MHVEKAEVQRKKMHMQVRLKTFPCWFGCLFGIQRSRRPHFMPSAVETPKDIAFFATLVDFKSRQLGAMLAAPR